MSRLPSLLYRRLRFWTCRKHFRTIETHTLQSSLHRLLFCLLLYLLLKENTMQNCLKINERTLSKIIKESISKLLNGTNNDSFDIESIFNLSKIPYEELKSQYADYSFFSQSSGFRIVKENIDIEEQAKNAKKEIQKIFNLKDWQVVIRQGENNVEVIVLFANIFKNSKLIKQEMKRLGFFPSLSKKIFKGFMLCNATKFEPYNNSARKPNGFIREMNCVSDFQCTS